MNVNNSALILGANHESYYGRGVKIYSSGSGEGLFIGASGTITASSHISSSGNVTTNRLNIPLTHDGGSNPSIIFGSYNLDGKIYDDDTDLILNYADTDAIKINDTNVTVETDNFTSLGKSTFGNNTTSDYHTFVGNITASGHISSSGGTITARKLKLTHASTLGISEEGGVGNFVIDNGAEGNVSVLTIFANTAAFTDSLQATRIKSTTHITASGHISASGKLFGNGLDVIGTSTFNDGDIDDVGVIQLDDAAADANSDNRIKFESDKIDTRINDSSVIEATETKVRILRESSGDGILEMTGNITASGNISASMIEAKNIVRATSYRFHDDNVYIADGGTDLDVVGGGLDIGGNVTASGQISSSGPMYSDGFFSDNVAIAYNHNNKAYLAYNVAVENINIGKSADIGVIFAGPITASNHISSSNGTGSFASLRVARAATFGRQITLTSAQSGESRINFGTVTDDQFIEGFGNQIVIDGDNYVELVADNEVKINAPKLGIGTNYSSNNADQVPEALTVEGNISASGGELYFGANTRLYESAAGELSIQNASGGELVSLQLKSVALTGAGWSLNSSGISLGHVSASGDISASNITVDNRIFNVGPTVANEAKGDIVRFGGGSISAGRIYYYSAGSWAAADHTNATKATGFLGFALGSSVADDGLLIRGFVNTAGDVGTDGTPIYLGSANGTNQDSAPTGTGEFVRIVGYMLDDSHGAGSLLWFDPDKSWVELS
jgi:hypothetical protein